jgi:hypothetical protein
MPIAKRTRDVYLRHPWALAAMQSAPPGVNAMRHMEQCLQALSGTDLTIPEKLTLLAVIDDFVFGYVLREKVAFARCRIDSGSVSRRSSILRSSE